MTADVETTAGNAMEAAVATLAAELDADHRAFLTADDDPAAAFDTMQWVSATLASGMDATTALAKLEFGVGHVQRLLRGMVEEHHTELLDRVHALHQLDSDLHTADSNLEALNVAMRSLTATIEEPHAAMQADLIALDNMDRACTLLRAVGRVMRLVERVHDGNLDGNAMEEGSATVARAKALAELERRMQDPLLSGVEIVERERAGVTAAIEEAVKSAQTQLRQGLDGKTSDEVSQALAIFHALGRLSTMITEIIAQIHADVKTHVANAFDPLRIPRPTINPTTQKKSVDTTEFWNGVVSMWEAVALNAIQVHRLNNAFTVVVDTQMSPVMTVAPGEFWTATAAAIEIELKKQLPLSPIMTQILQTSGYPRLLRLHNDCFQRVITELGARSEDPTLTAHHATVRRSMASLESIYLSRSLARLFDPVNVAFGRGPRIVPTKTDLRAIVRVVMSELEAAKHDDELLGQVTRNVAKTVNLYAVKSEAQIATDSSAYAILVNPPPMNQLHNFEVANNLSALTESLSATRESFPESTLAALRESAESTRKLFNLILEPLFVNLMQAVAEAVARMHREDLSGAAPVGGEVRTSKYVGELARIMTHVENEVIARLLCKSDLKLWITAFASRLLLVFLRHASFVRPLGESGKLQLTKDLAQIEFALGPLIDAVGLKTSDLGMPFQALRAFRPMLYLATSQFMDSPLRASVDIYTTIHQLFARAHSDLKLPHVRFAMRESEYVTWINSHTLSEWIALIGETLRIYEEEMNRKGAREFAPEYPVIVRLLDKASA